MKILALDIPDTLFEKQAWLADRLVADDIGDFVIQLHVIGSDETSSKPLYPKDQSVEQILGDDRSGILSGGFASLTDEQIHALLLSPRALLQLHEEIFIFGGPYWDEKLKHLTSAETSVESSPRRVSGAAGKVAPQKSSSMYRWGAAIAALLLIGVAGSLLLQIGKDSPPVVAEGWGWQRADWFEGVKTSDEYLDRIVKGAEAWSAKPVDTKDAYAKRLKELIAGCQKMIDGEHPLLTATQKKEVVDRCMKWQEQFIAQLSEVTENPQNLREIKQKTDETIEKAIGALKKIKSA